LLEIVFYYFTAADWSVCCKESINVLKSISLAAWLLMGLALLGLAMRGALFSLHPVALLSEAIALVLLLWARFTLGRRSLHAAANPTAGGLVTTGPYHYIRHPIYSAVCLFGWTGIVMHWSLINALLGALLLAAAAGRMLSEERLLVAAYPEYRKYAQTTKRIVPYIV